MNLTPREQAEVEAALGLAVDPVAPSPGLKASIMAKLAETPQLAPLVSDATLDSEAPTDVTTIGETQRTAEQRARTRWFSRPVSILAAAAAVVVFFVGGTVVGAQFSGSHQPSFESESLATLAAASDLERATAEVAGGGDATLIWSLSQRKSAILINSLPPLPESKTYQLWYIGAAGPIPAGTFDSNTSATSWRVLDGAMSGGDTVGVTIEPAGGSAQPTTDPIVAISSS